MPNKTRPACPTCGYAMAPLWRRGPRGQAFVRVPEAYVCCGNLAGGRDGTRLLEDVL